MGASTLFAAPLRLRHNEWLLDIIITNIIILNTTGNAVVGVCYTEAHLDVTSALSPRNINEWYSWFDFPDTQSPLAFKAIHSNLGHLSAFLSLFAITVDKSGTSGITQTECIRASFQKKRDDNRKDVRELFFGEQREETHNVIGSKLEIYENHIWLWPYRRVGCYSGTRSLSLNERRYSLHV